MLFENQQFHYCLLCEQIINEQFTWSTLLTRTFTSSICKKCTQQFKEINCFVDNVYCMYEYNEAMRSYFQRYKFLKDVLLAHVFRVSVERAVKNILNEIKKQYKGAMHIIVVPIPMHTQQLANRTFAHVDEILKAANIRYTHLLEKNTTITQSSKNRAERIATKELFTLKKYQEADHVLLFDDIKTTGTTLKLAEHVLVESGIKNITSIALAAVL